MMGSEILQSTVSKKTNDQPDNTVLAISKAYLTLGQVDKATQLLAAMDPAHLKFGQQGEKFTLLSTLGDLYLQQGKLHLAAATYYPLLDLVDEAPFDVTVCHFYERLCALYYEWNHLAKAQQYLRGCLEKIQRYKLGQTLLLIAYLGLTWVFWADGLSEAANEAMQQAMIIAQSSDDADFTRETKAHQARLWLKSGNLQAANQWAQACGLTVAEPLPYRRQFEYLTLIRILISQRRGREALLFLDLLLAMATATERGHDILEILVLKALAYHAQGDLRQALVELAEALCRAEREGYIRTFVDEGAPMAALLHHMVDWGVTVAYVKQLLDIFATDGEHGKPRPDSANASLPTNSSLVEPLTKRELEVLRLVTAGNSNEDVARLLNIAPTTVKKHLGNILGKLSAKNRTQAVAKAQALGLL
jgi:LuxR family transcriptional regulator, maltose regulon positive regulatory protein